MRPSWPPPMMPIVAPGAITLSSAGIGLFVVGLVGHRGGLSGPPIVQPFGQGRIAKASTAAASRAALMAPDLPMANVPTGTPPGICTIDSRLSSLLAPCFRSGRRTPAARHRRGHAGEMGGPPAPAMMTLRPRPLASPRNRRGAGECGGPRRCASRRAPAGRPGSRAACRIVGQSDWLPMMMPTNAFSISSGLPLAQERRHYRQRRGERKKSRRQDPGAKSEIRLENGEYGRQHDAKRIDDAVGRLAWWQAVTSSGRKTFRTGWSLRANFPSSIHSGCDGQESRRGHGRTNGNGLH